MLLASKEGICMTKWKIGLLALMVMGLTGCAARNLQPPLPDPTLELYQETEGWVEVRVSGITAPGYRIHWGEKRAHPGYSDVLLDQEIYGHFYQEPGQYTITLIDKHNRIITVDQAPVMVTVTVRAVNCHLALIAVEGRTITVRYFGRAGVSYSISWGDGHGASIIASYTGTGILTHTYNAPGTYAVGMAEIWAPLGIFFEVEIE